MSDKSYLIDPKIHAYVREHSLRESDLLLRLREETGKHERAEMQITPEQGQLFQVLVKALHAKRVLEVGVFTGYSSLSIALALPPDGDLIACDISDEYTKIARRYWREAGVEGKIDLRLGPALETLESLHKSGYVDTFDFAFIDADKTNCWNYFELILPMMQKHGLIVIDNVLQRGRILDMDSDNADTSAMREFNLRLASDRRVQLSMLPVADGLTLALKY
ncbi:MAG: class I SAM-dependent methyltransferase [Bryobacteraceae bacterium]